MPAWVQSLPLYEWYAVPGTQMNLLTADSVQGMFAYSGGALKAAGSEMFLVGGGHNDHWRNEVWSVKLGQATPTMQKLCESTPFAQIGWTNSDTGSTHYTDGRPASRHTYWQVQFIDQINKLILIGAPAVYGNGNGSFNVIDAFDPVTSDYMPAGTFAPVSIHHVGTPTCKDASGNIWQHSPFSGNMAYWSPSATSSGAPGFATAVGARGATTNETCHCVDTNRNIMFRTGRSSISMSATWWDLSNNGAATNVTLVGDPGDVAAVRLIVNMTFDPVNDCFWVLSRGSSTLYKITVSGTAPSYTFTVSQQATTGTFTGPTAQNDALGAGYGRWAYAPELKGIVWWHRETQPVRFLRTSV